MYKLLFADDEKWIIESLKKAVDWEEQGFQIIGEAHNGLEAYDKIIELKPDVVFVDIRMPGMSGLELIEKVAASRRRIETVVASGYAEFEYAQKAMNLGAAGFCLKPFKREEILKVLQQVKKKLDRHKMTFQPSAEDESEKANIQPLLQYVHDHFASDITVQSVSKTFFMHPNYLSQLFKKEVGVNFTKYVTNIRMEYACGLLSHSALTVSEIAEKTGYKDYFYFARIFKRHTGKTPTEYREKA